jgi:formamidopyrimidine-DNA glycosylase
MPELPEVETMRRGIRGVIGGHIRGMSRPRCRLKPILISPPPTTFRRRVVGRSIRGVDRVGKRVVLRLDNGDRMVFEPRMAGLVLVADPPDRAHLRFQLHLSGASVGELAYWDRRGLGSVQLFTPEQFATRFGPDRLGPDALNVGLDDFRQALSRGRREVKVALLDQRTLAGVGNLYASEILHVARIHPQSRCDRLTAGQWKRLHAALLDVLHEAVRYEGSTLADGTYRNALNKRGSYQNHHRVYNRAGERCPRCHRAKIVRRVQAQRATFFCPNCQRPPR